MTMLVTLLNLWLNKAHLNEKGQGQTEYMIILSVVVLVILGALTGFGYAVYVFWDDLIAALPF